MATTISTPLYTAVAGADLVEADYCKLLKWENDGGEAKAIKVTATTDTVIGLYAMRGPASDGHAISVMKLQGVIKCVAQSAITAGQVVAPHTNGNVVGVASLADIPTGGMAIGTAMKTATAGEVFPVWADPLAGSA